MFLSSFKPALEIIKIPPTLLPQKVDAAQLQHHLPEAEVLALFPELLIVSSSITLIAIFSSSLAGFVFTKFKFPGKEVIFIVFLAGLMIPFSIIVLPLYLFISLGLVNTYLGLILPMCVSPFGIFLMRQFMEGIPNGHGGGCADRRGVQPLDLLQGDRSPLHGGNRRRWGSSRSCGPGTSCGGLSWWSPRKPCGPSPSASLRSPSRRQAIRHDRDRGVPGGLPRHAGIHLSQRTLIKGMTLTG